VRQYQRGLPARRPPLPQLRNKLLADADLSRVEARATEFGSKVAGLDTVLADPEIDIVLNHTTSQAMCPSGWPHGGRYPHATKSAI
jgi:predicted dehydrogenase